MHRAMCFAIQTFEQLEKEESMLGIHTIDSHNSVMGLTSAKDSLS